MLHILTALLLALIISLPTPATAKDFEFNINVSASTTVDAGTPIPRKNAFRFADVYGSTSDARVTIRVFAQLDDIESSATTFKGLLAAQVVERAGGAAGDGSLMHIPLTGKFITLQIENVTGSATDVTLRVVLRRR